MKVINENKRLLFTLKEKTSGPLVVAPEELTLLDESLKETTPVDSRPYKVYTALLTQSGTNAPVATVLENTLGGNVVWSRGGKGYYIATSSGLFTIDKTGVFIEPSSNLAITGYFQVQDKTINTVEITTADKIGTADNGLYKTSIEIRVYN